MNEDMVLAREQKRKELEEKYIPNKVRGVLTAEEINWSSKAGVVIGFVVLLAIIITIAWWMVHL
jgi:hypothetical protein